MNGKECKFYTEEGKYDIKREMKKEVEPLVHGSITSLEKIEGRITVGKGKHNTSREMWLR
jgi:hypothetical protein